MIKSTSFIIVILPLLVLTLSCKKNDKNSVLDNPTSLTFDSTLVAPFFKNHPELKKYSADVKLLYKKQHYNYIWYDQEGTKEVADVLYNKIINLDDEGLPSKIPYRNELEAIFEDDTDTQKPNVTSELLISSLYFFYAKKVYKGIDIEKSKELGWYLPRKKMSLVSYLDSIVANPSLFNKDEKEVLGQYYRLRESLKKYRNLEKKENKTPIVLDSGTQKLIPKDSAQVIAQIRARLFLLGDLESDSKSLIYDEELVTGVLKYKKRNGLDYTTTISESNLKHLSVPLANRIKTIVVNMERCRWISKTFTNTDAFIFINIPSYELRYFKNGKTILESKVVVGKAMNKTVVFSADMKYIVFNPYWNVPKNILKKEILPAIAKNPNYMKDNDMEWHQGAVRQKPGRKNALGQVKFLFPNSNSIYLHDTPSKGLFDQEKRAFSHGCIRIEKRKELLHLLLKDDKNWSPEKIEATLSEGKEKWYTLENKIPVFIGYFTAWTDRQGVIHFYEDVYKRDERLATMLLE